MRPTGKDTPLARGETPWIRLGLPLLLGLAIAGAYLSGLDAPFILDDHIWVAKAARTSDGWPPQGHPNRPVLAWSLALNARLLGDAPVAFRAVNVALHVAATLVLFGLVRRSLRLPRVPDSLRERRTLVAFGAALLWGLHPLQTMAVTYIWQRGESMMGLFFLLTFYTFLRSVESGGARSIGWITASVCAYALGCGTKEVMAAALPLLFVYDVTLLTGSFRASLGQRWGRYVPHAALTVLFVLGMKFTLRATNSSEVSLLDYLTSQPGVVLHYVRLAFWPAPLCFDYDWQPARSFTAVALPTLLVLIGIGWSLRGLWHGRARAFLPLWFFLVLAPTSSIIVLNDLAAEYRMYLPLAALTTGAALCLATRSGLLAEARIPTLVAVATGLFVSTVRRNQEYRDPSGIWSSALAVAPHNSRAYSHLSAIHLQDRRFADAERDALRALELDPDDAAARLNLGYALMGSGRELEAVAQFEACLSSRHGRDRVRLHLQAADLLLKNGKLEEAKRHYQAVRGLRPSNVEASLGLATLLTRLNRLPQALVHAQRALEHEPENVQALLLVAKIHGLLGEEEKALGSLDRARGLAPDDLEVLALRGSLLGALRRFDEAGAAFVELLERDPGKAVELSAMARAGSGSRTCEPAERAMYVRIAETAARVTGQRDGRVLENVRQTLRNSEPGHGSATPRVEPSSQADDGR